ncbi:TVP38/TMEM64 family membrane protein slr0305-like [Phoenix dactylifera]|uniref:TVP38/TMEM64 family membrane protein slr0305-like n=1 Tax=Phoenix dactylifera TaxID=42345 RepID=A0A8B9AH44_PHODC|nr:TVP38/TMEM64 family membrane protein slr0305-like [Phoenix dactylifera]XP_038982594.1 TVP38/TMEM64 family membrane protein slr0305-like [Phoenix dactylifera]
MTYGVQSEDDIVVLGQKMGIGDGSGDYVKLGDLEAGRFVGVPGQCHPKKWNSLWWWMKVVLLSLGLLAGTAAVILCVGPVIIKKVVVPILDWEMTTFSRPVLGLLLFTAIALFPALLVPSSPCMWIAGMTFGYGYGYLLIMAGTSIGMSLPFLIGSHFRHRIHRWLENWPKKAAIVRIAGEGDWFHQFRAVTLLRISPFPYLIFNYSSVATNVKYGPYICGSLIGTVPENFLTIYSGKLLQALADATNRGGFLSVEQIIYDALGFFAAIAATAAITVYAKRTLQTLQAEEELS